LVVSIVIERVNAIEKVNAIEDVRKIVGSTESKQALLETI